MFLLIALLVVSSICMLTATIIPYLEERLNIWHSRKEKIVEKKLDELFYDKSPKRVMRLYYIVPPLLAIIGFLIFQSLIFLLIGAVGGVFIPSLILKIRDNRRRKKFADQILDTIMILSSSLKGGLSFLQALEVIQEEMPAPMSQEIGLVVRENRMGVSLEESLDRLNQRMSNIEELTLISSSIKVARETGGDLTKVLSRLSITIRDDHKLKDNIKTLTLQGRMQGMIMSILPFLFVGWILMFNREHFDIMFHNEFGRMLLLIAGVLEVAGLILIKKFSAIKL